MSVAPEQRRRAAVEHAPDAAHDRITEILVDRRHLPREAAEHEAVHESGAQLARTVILHAERRRHAALAFDAVLERDAGKVAFQVVCPSVIDAAESFFVRAAIVEADERATMRAAVLKRADLAARIASNDDRSVTDERGAEITRFGQLHLKA